MSVYAYNNIFKMERTMQHTAINSFHQDDVIDIPLITVNSTDYRPVGFAIAAASGDFRLGIVPADNATRVAVPTSPVVAADLAASNQIVIALGPTDEIVLQSVGGELVDIRWFWTHNVLDGNALGTFDYVNLDHVSIDMDATAAEEWLTIPEGTQSMVILELSGDGLTYRVDAAAIDTGSLFSVSDLEFANASGATVDLLSPLGELNISIGDYLQIAGHPIDGNNGLYIVTTENIATEDYTVEKLSGANPIDDLAEPTDFYYLVDGTQITVLAADVSYSNPYTIHVNEADRLRIVRSGVGDITITGYWRIA